MTHVALVQFGHSVVQGAETIGIAVDPHVIEGLTIHYSRLLAWAPRINLTTLLDPEVAASKHALDSLLFAESFDSDSAETVLDVGSGAGFPGLVLAIARPRLRITLMEPIRKRASFLRVVLAELERADVEVQQSRLEPAKGGGPMVDAIVSRATIPPLSLIGLAAPRISKGGRLILTAGGDGIGEEELVTAAADAGFEHKERSRWSLPGGHRRVLDTLVRV